MPMLAKSAGEKEVSKIKTQLIEVFNIKFPIFCNDPKLFCIVEK